MDERLRGLIALGREHYKSRDFAAAERCFTEVVKEHRGFADVFDMLGCIYHSQGKLPSAQEAFEEALRINPNYTEAALNLAITYNDQGKYQQAREVYSHAIKRTREEPRSLDPFVKGKLANMHADLGAAYAESGLWPEAIREYRQALELCPSFVDLRTRLAAVYRDQGDAQAALRELEIVKTMNPRYVPARLSLGTALYMAGRRDEAVREWEAVIATDAENKAAQAFLHMARDVARKPAAPAPPPTAETSVDRDIDQIFDGVGTNPGGKKA